jgi:Zn ribbon nucleic-acid-binding protein
MTNKKKRYGKCPNCNEYQIHLFHAQAKDVHLTGDRYDALNEQSGYWFLSSFLDDFWAYKCVKCGHVTAMGFLDKSFIENAEDNEQLSLAIKNDTMEQILIDLLNMYPEDVEFIMKNYGIEL